MRLQPNQKPNFSPARGASNDVVTVTDEGLIIDPYVDAISFNGTSDRVDVSDTALPLLRSNNWSMAVHVNTTIITNQAILSYHRGSSNRSGMITAGSQFRGGTFGSPWNGGNNAPYTPGLWYHYGITHAATGEVVTSYLNGAAVASGNGSSLGNISASNRSWGYTTNGGFYFTGMMLLGKIFDSTLTADNMLFLSTFGAMGTDPGDPIHTLEQDV